MGWGTEARRASLLPAPFGFGDSSGNHKIGQSAGANRLVYRIVPQKTGTIWDVWVETRARTGPACSPQLADADSAESSSYSGGDPNNWLWEVRFHPVNADGTFDPNTNLVPVKQFNPYTQRRNTSLEYGSVLTLSALKIPAGSVASPFTVTKGVPFAMTVAPINGAPATDYASCNHLASPDGHDGAQARNEILSTARDVFYGLDPRTMLGGSNAAGTSQWYPGNNFNTAPFSKHLPTYLLVYTDGVREGQPYFSAALQSQPLTAATQYVMNYKVPQDVVFTHLCAAFAITGTVTATLAVNGVDKETVTLPGTASQGQRMVRRRLAAQVPVVTTDSVTVTFTLNIDNVLSRIYANGVFENLLSMGSSYQFWLTGDTKHVATIYPSPWPAPLLVSGSAPHGAPGIPTGLTATGNAGFAVLDWADNAEAYISSYNVYRDGVFIANAPASAYTDTSLAAGTYSYTVQAVGLDGRTSGQTGGQSATVTAGSSGATPAYVGARGTLTSSTAGTTQVVTLTSDTTSGNRLVVAAAGRGGGTALTGVTDSKGNTWTIAKQLQDAGSNNTIALASGHLATALVTGDTVTLTWNSTIGQSNVAELHEFSGVLSSGATDQSGSTASATSTATPTVTATGSTTQAKELVVAAFTIGSGGTTSVAAGSGGTLAGTRIATSGATNGDRSLVMAYLIVTSTGTQTLSLSVSPNGTNFSVLATLKGA